MVSSSVLSVTTKPSIMSSGSIEAAVLMAPVATPGEPVTKKESPSLPAEVTTITPASTALFAATAELSSTEP